MNEISEMLLMSQALAHQAYEIMRIISDAMRLKRLRRRSMTSKPRRAPMKYVIDAD